MLEFLEMRGARKLVRTCADVREGETVIVVTDYATIDVARRVALAAQEVTEDVSILTMPPREIDGQEPPDAIAAALQHADVIFSAVKQSITHTFAVRNAIQARARAIMLTQYNPGMLIKGGLDADFHAMQPLCFRVGELMDAAEDVHLTTPAGTDLRLSIKGRHGNPHSGIVRKPGDFTTVPNIETSASPVEKTATGRIVADASIPYYDIGLLSEPIVFDVADGRVQKITGGHQAEALAALLARQNAPDVYNIAQISFGLNPQCPMEGVMLHDEGVYGTSHIGIGTSVLLGGEVKTLTHFDALMWKPTLKFDGKEVLREGEWLLPEADVVHGKREGVS